MPLRLDLLFPQEGPPSPMSRMLGGAQSLVASLMAAKQQREMEELQQSGVDRRQAAQLAFQREQEARVAQHQQMVDAREREQFGLQQKQQMARDVGSVKDPRMLPLVAQAYGGSVADKPMPKMDIVKENPDSPIGFDPNDEYFETEEAISGRKVLNLPGMEPMDLPGPDPSFYQRYGDTLARLGGGPALLARVKEGEALGLDNEKTSDLVERERQRELQRELAAGRKKTGGGSRATGPGTKSADDARADMNAYLTNQGYKADAASNRQFDRMIASADEASKGNPAAARVFMGMFAKFAQGETGVLTASDMDIFWNQAGSPKERTEEALEKMVSGGLGKAKQASAVRAIQALKVKAQERMDAMYEGASEVMKPYGADGERWLRSYFGRGQRTPKGSGGHDEADALLRGLK